MTARLSRFLFTLILVFLGGITPLWAQQDSTVLFPVSGRVTDTLGESIPFATVRIRPQASADSTQFWGQVTDANGFFRIGLPAAGNYEIHITCIGMDPLTQSFRTTRTQGYSLGNLKMKEGRTELAGVTVTQTRKLVKIEIDKISYDINKDPDSRTSNLLRMLRKVPLITVDGRGNIQVNGSSNFTIYQNGKRNSMFRSNGKEVLRSIPASSIRRIEVMTKPGVKYDADNSGAIINIVTEENQFLQGFAGSVGGHVGNYGQYGGNLFLTARTEKVGLTGGVNLEHLGSGRGSSVSETNMGGIRLRNEGDESMYSDSQRFHATLTYEMDNRNLFSVSTNGLLSKSTRENNMQEKMWQDLMLKTYRQNNSVSTQQSGSFYVTADYQHSTKIPGELFTVGYMFDRSPNNGKTRVIRMLLNPTNGQMLPSGFAEQFTETQASMNEHTAQMDYVRPLGDKHKIEAGVKYIARRSGSNPLYQIRTSSDGAFIPGSLYGQHLNSGALHYAQDIMAVYTGWTARWSNKINTQLGARAEYSLLDVKYDRLPEADFKRNVLDWVPQVRLSYNLNNSCQLSTNYDFRISRPGIRQMNPYRLQTSEYNLQYGNPRLKAQRNHSVDLTFNYYSGKVMLSCVLYHEFSRNAIRSYTRQDDSMPGVLQTTYDNLGRYGSFRIVPYFSYRPNNWMRLSLNANVVFAHIRNEAVQQTEHWRSAMLYGSTTFMLPKQWEIQMNGSINKYDGYQSKANVMHTSSVAVSKSLLNDRLNLSLSVVNPFESSLKYISRLKGIGYEGESVTIDHGARMLRLDLNYSFGEMKRRIKRIERKIVNDDLMTK